jgi:hypothetical protein
MSLLDEVRRKYQTPISPTAKTAKSPLGSSGSESLEGFESHEMEMARQTLEIVRMRERGEVPDHYTAKTTCKHCGEYKACRCQRRHRESRYDNHRRLGDDICQGDGPP